MQVYMPVQAGPPGGGRPPTDLTELDLNGWVNQRGLSRKHIFESVQASLKRLDMDYVDVLQCHRTSPLRLPMPAFLPKASG